ncbi:MAG: hypothetical protein FWE33_04605 [Defluviitaleaceae bacterium]|nr:hypothetical protein [Defluviitaleaceae bacterium]
MKKYFCTISVIEMDKIGVADADKKVIERIIYALDFETAKNKAMECFAAYAAKAEKDVLLESIVFEEQGGESV